MRIVLSCLQALRPHAISAYAFWRDYFIGGCEEAGIECLEVPAVDWAEGLACVDAGAQAAWLARTWDTALAYVRAEHQRRPLDFFLGYLYPQQVEPAAVAELQRIGIPCVNFFCDNVREFRRVPEEYRAFALHWVPEFEALPLYRHAALPHVHAPMPCWVAPAYREPPLREAEPPTFIGSADILRRQLLGHAMSTAGDLVVRGPGWRQQEANGRVVSRSVAGLVANQISVVRAGGWPALRHKIADKLHPLCVPAADAARTLPAVFGDEYLRITREALVTVGINRVPTSKSTLRRPLAYSRLRDIEAPMLGACYLTEWTAGVEQLYDIGVEVECYRNADELSFKLAALKQDRARRRAMRERAQRRALSQHSVARTLDRIARHLGVSLQR